MIVLKYITIPAILVLLAACSSVPENSGTDEASTPTNTGSVSTSISTKDAIICVQAGLNQYGFEAGPEDGVIRDSAKEALTQWRKWVDASVPALTEQAAVGLCDVMNQNIVPFGVDTDGESDREIAFRLYAQDETTVIVEVLVSSGYKQLIYIGANQVTNASKYCIQARAGYTLTDTSGETSQETCNDYVQQETPEFVIIEATLNKS